MLVLAHSEYLIQPLCPLVLFFLFFYLLNYPALSNKKQKENGKNACGKLNKGDKIVTIGGIHGVIQSVKEGTVVVIG
jgi:preprotein translocase subunit YajC